MDRSAAVRHVVRSSGSPKRGDPDGPPFPHESSLPPKSLIFVKMQPNLSLLLFDGPGGDRVEAGGPDGYVVIAGAIQFCASEIGALQRRSAQLGVPQRGTGQVGAVQHRACEV